MDILKEEIVLLCENFIRAVGSLHESGRITDEEYFQMTRLKYEYIDYVKKLE